MPISLGDHVVTKNIRCENITTSSVETNTLLVNGEILENIVSSNANVQADFSQQDDTKDDYIKHKPQIVDWTTDQLDVEIDANNIPALPYPTSLDAPRDRRADGGLPEGPRGPIGHA